MGDNRKPILKYRFWLDKQNISAYSRTSRQVNAESSVARVLLADDTITDFTEANILLARFL